MSSNGHNVFNFLHVEQVPKVVQNYIFKAKYQLTFPTQLSQRILERLTLQKTLYGSSSTQVQQLLQKFPLQLRLPQFPSRLTYSRPLLPELHDTQLPSRQQTSVHLQTQSVYSGQCFMLKELVVTKCAFRESKRNWFFKSIQRYDWLKFHFQLRPVGEMTGMASVEELYRRTTDKEDYKKLIANLHQLKRHRQKKNRRILIL